VLGGAETLCRLLAENLVAHGSDVTVLTTCAVNHFTWANQLPAGASTEGGVPVRRFAVGPRDRDAFLRHHTEIALGADVSYSTQLLWMANSVWSPEMLDVIHDPAQYDWIVPIPYLFGTTFWATVARPRRTALIPCLHDEAHARQPVVLDCLSAARGVLANTTTEEALITSMLSGHRDCVEPERITVVGVGYDEAPLPPREAVQAFSDARGIEPGYLLYAGRREEGKGLPELFDLYRQYRASTPSPRPLALMGSGDLRTPEDLRPWVIDLGFVPDASMRAAFGGAAVLLHPSRLESLGMVMLEAWLAGTPAIVNGQSAVLVEHCRHGGGLWWNSTPEFIEAVRLVTEDEVVRGRLALAGREYVLSRFRWAEVRRRFTGALEDWS
jgi:glycosyltransferase involved in cell wall biosynthesis